MDVTSLKCPSCGGDLEPGWVSAGKGPLRWVERPDQHKTVFGGERLAKQHWLWGRQTVRGARCTRCRIAVIDYDEGTSD